MIKTARLLSFGFILCVLFLLFAFPFRTAHAQTPTPLGGLQLNSFIPGEPNWDFDPEVTQVGRNAERARQFIYWTVTHPPIFNAPVLGQTWAFTRNVAYVLTVFVIIGLALQLVLSSRTVGPIFSGISIGM